MEGSLYEITEKEMEAVLIEIKSRKIARMMDIPSNLLKAEGEEEMRELTP